MIACEIARFPLLQCLCYQQLRDIIRGVAHASMAKQRTKPVRIRSTATRALKPGPGRPPVHNETWSKVSVVLFDRQIAHLDRLAMQIRVKGAKLLNRAEIIRALIDGLIDSGMVISGTISEKDLRTRVARRLGSPYR
jgi:hypothetical protein